MWLLNTRTVKLHPFVTKIPDYVILSHTWGEREVSFDDIGKPHAKSMTGYTKISQCCAQAQRDGFEWAWVDTCCIDKRSSAELSEAINSMYKWYWDAAICYAFIADFTLEGPVTGRSRLTTDEELRGFQTSRWFTRGWTLQELLAPDVVEFYDSNWSLIGTKSSLLESIHAATEIETQHLLNRDTIERASIAARFSWASSRTTTRVEDMAYCLLGLVQVNMPMLYGEGERAFYRLQLEIIKQTNEHTIFAWEPVDTAWYNTSIFASSPTHFGSASQLRPSPPRVQGKLATHEVTNSGLSITLPCISVDQSRAVAILNCTNLKGAHIGIWLERTGDGKYRRLPGPRVTIAQDEVSEANPVTMYVEVDKSTVQQQSKQAYSMTVRKLSSTGYHRIVGIATGSRSSINSHQIMASASISRSIVLNDLVIRDGQFACINFDFTIIPKVKVMCAFALHQGRSWLRLLCNEGLFTVDKVEEVRKSFEADTQLPLPTGNDTRSHFRDYAELRSMHHRLAYDENKAFRTLMGFVLLAVSAKKSRSSEETEWGITITIES